MIRPIAFFLCAMPLIASAQQTFIVHVGGSTSGGALPYYTPDMLTINMGDTVRWVKDNGTHNVYGELDDFPDNPEGFSSGTPTGTMWPYHHVFTIPGTYGYHCTQQGHGATQHGMVEVVNSTGIDAEETTLDQVRVFPVPANDALTILTQEIAVQWVEVITVDGRSIRSRSMRGTERLLLPLAGIPIGNYVLRLHAANGEVKERRFTKE